MTETTEAQGERAPTPADAKATRAAEVQAGKDRKAEEKAEAKAAKRGAKREGDEVEGETWRPKAGRACRFRFMTTDSVVHTVPAKVTKVHKGGAMVDVEVDAVHFPGLKAKTMVAERVVEWVQRPGHLQTLPAFQPPPK